MKILGILFPFLLAGCGSGNTMVGNFPQWLGELVLFLIAGAVNTVVYTWPLWSWGAVVWLLWKILCELRAGTIAYHLAQILRELLHRKVAIAFIALLLTSGCINVPIGTREITFWGVGFLPIAGIPVPFAGYWHSTHGDRPGEKSAQPPNPFSSRSEAKPTMAGGATRIEFSCISIARPKAEGAVVTDCADPQSWKEWSEKQRPEATKP